MSQSVAVERPTTALPGTEAQAPVVVRPANPVMEMIRQAVAAGQPLDVIRELKAMAKELAEDEARRAFDVAFAAAKAEITPIVRRRDGHNSKYADFGDIASEIDPILSRHGLSYRHRSEVSGSVITVVCRLTHTAGHSEETPLPAPPDTSGSKNPIQAIGSTLTYLQRYTLLLALGLATAKDDDGKAAGTGNVITDEQRDKLLALADEVGADISKFCAYFKVDNVAALPAAHFDRAIKSLESKRAK